MRLFLRQFSIIFRRSWANEFANPGRVLSCLLFSLTVLVIFTLARGQVPDDMHAQFYVMECFITGFFALQLIYLQIFEDDGRDRVFDLLRTYPISPSAWYLGKWAMTYVVGIAILLPTLLFGALFHEAQGNALLSWHVAMIGMAALFGLTALGVLLAVLTQLAQAKQILYPLLYFPLSIPVMLAAVEACNAYYDKDASFMANAGSWLGLLLVFDVLFFTLGLLFFGEMIKAD